MATPTIKIDQATQPAGTAGQSRDNLVLSQVVTLTDPANPGGTVWNWQMISRPTGSSATLSGATTATATFTPDVRGTYLIRLEVDGFKSWTELVDNNLVLFHKSTTQGGCAVKYADGTRIPAAGETNEFPPGLPSAGGWHVAMEDFIARTVSRLHLGLYAAAVGALPYVSSGANLAALAPGTNGHVLTLAAGLPTWAAPTGGGATWDGVYDFGGAGAGRSSTVDSGAWQALGNAADNNNVFEIEKKPAGAQTGHGLKIELNANASDFAARLQHDGIGSDTETSMLKGLYLVNTTAAINGTQQASPDAILSGRGWSEAASASRVLEWGFRVLPIQVAASEPSSLISLRYRANGSAWATMFQFNSANQLIAAGLGTAALPIFAAGSTTTGMYGVSTSQLGWSVSGTSRMTLSSSVLAVAATAAIRGEDGTSSLPFYSFTGNTGLGMYRSTNALGLRAVGTIDLNINGTVMVTVGSNVFYPTSNAVTQLGQSGLRWTFIYGQSLDLSQAVVAGSTALPALKVAGAAHTTQTAGAEIIDVDFALNRTVQHAAGAVTTQRAAIFRAPTYSFASASTITDAATLAITGAPVAGTNGTITNSYALWVQAGKSKFGGVIDAVGPGDASTGAFTIGTEGIDKIAASTISTVVGGFEHTRFNSSGIVSILGGLSFNLSENTTKLYRDAANSMAIDISGAEAFRIRADGARFSKSVRTVPVALTDGATVTPDLVASNQFTWTAAGNRTLANPSNIVAGMQWQIDYSQDGTGGRTITWGTSYKGPSGAAVSTIQPFSGANQITVFTFKAITTTNIVVIKSAGYY